MASQQTLDFLAFLDIADTRALKAYANSVTVHSDDLSGLILASDVGAIPIGHIAIHRHYHPPHLHLSSENLDALATNGVGRLSSGAQTTVNKVMATFRERRLFNAHFFWLVEFPHEWHLLYFDQRDTSGEHWVAGPHIHLMNHVTHPRLSGETLLRTLHEGEKPPRLKHSLHLRYERGRRSEGRNRDDGPIDELRPSEGDFPS